MTTELTTAEQIAVQIVTLMSMTRHEHPDGSVTRRTTERVHRAIDRAENWLVAGGYSRYANEDTDILQSLLCAKLDLADNNWRSKPQGLDQTDAPNFERQRRTECDRCHTETWCCSVDYGDGSGEWDYCRKCWLKLAKRSDFEGC